ncbi:GNAT family N-acetyltransferase [Salinisphaera sp. T5B8]|uniref:GNAT family N-acetyltransferase n=1 Tax=Salinisphaera sp. T5B8 TaxID=1304154 RepID=UPI00334144EC
MTQCLLQPATRAIDHHRVAELANRIWYEHYPGIISRAQIEYMLATQYDMATLERQQNAGTRFVLAWIDDTAVGFAGVSPDAQTRGCAWLDKLYILAAYRGQGIGRRLIDWAAHTAAELDATMLYLRVNRHNAASVAMYQHTGFDIEREDVKSIGHGFVMDDYIMRMPIPEDSPT